jgi:hypothetical protein
MGIVIFAGTLRDGMLGGLGLFEIGKEVKPDSRRVMVRDV